MPRAHPASRACDQIRTLFHAGSLGALTDGSCSTGFFPRTGFARKWRLPGSWNGTGRWFWAFAGGCFRTATSPKTPFRRRFSILLDEPGREESRFTRRMAASLARRIAMRLRSSHGVAGPRACGHPGGRRAIR